jgi:hypothetical protein
MKLISFSIGLIAAIVTQSTQASSATYFARLLEPGGFIHSEVNSVVPGYQVGNGFGPATIDVAARLYRYHALLWHGRAESVVDLNPSNFSDTWLKGASLTHQVGYGREVNSNSIHALLWSGTSDSIVDLNRSDFYESYAFAVAGNNQVGWGFGSNTDGRGHALLWHGSAGSVIDLHPAGFESSSAYATTVARQAGSATSAALNFAPHAILWNGTADSAVDLTPPGLVGAYITGMDDFSQVGGGSGPMTNGVGHALLWSGTPQSAIDLHPSGFTYTEALAVAEYFQVGYGVLPNTDNVQHALLWRGSAASVIDLHPYVAGLGAFIGSRANGVLPSGDVVGYAYDANYRSHAVIWLAVPEPSLLTLATVAFFAIGSSRCRSIYASGVASKDRNESEKLVR